MLDSLKLELIDKVEEPRFNLREHCLVRHKLPRDLLLRRLVQRTAAINRQPHRLASQSKDNRTMTTHRQQRNRAAQWGFGSIVHLLQLCTASAKPSRTGRPPTIVPHGTERRTESRRSAGPSAASEFWNESCTKQTERVSHWPSDAKERPTDAAIPKEFAAGPHDARNAQSLVEGCGTQGRQRLARSAVQGMAWQGMAGVRPQVCAEGRQARLGT